MNKCLKRLLIFAGKYTLVATNVAGKKVANIKFLVVGKPGSVTGPLQISELTADSAVLSWKPPKDNGGKKSAVPMDFARVYTCLCRAGKVKS